MRDLTLLALIGGVLVGSACMTSFVRQWSLKRGILDRPNARSSHEVPTPRGGGLAIVLLTSAGVTTLWACRMIGLPLLTTFLVGGGAVALVGYLDDRGHM